MNKSESLKNCPFCKTPIQINSEICPFCKMVLIERFDNIKKNDFVNNENQGNHREVQHNKNKKVKYRNSQKNYFLSGYKIIKNKKVFILSTFLILILSYFFINKFKFPAPETGIYTILFIVTVFISLLLWHLNQLHNLLFDSHIKRQWSFPFSVFIRISWVILTTIGLFNNEHIAFDLYKIGPFLSSCFLLFSIFAISQFHIAALDHLKMRKKLVTSFGFPQFGGGEPRTKFNKAFHSGEPSLAKSIANMVVFSFLIISTCYTLIVYPSIAILGPSLVYGLLIFLSFLFRTDLFIPSDSISEFKL